MPGLVLLYLYSFSNYLITALILLFSDGIQAVQKEALQSELITRQVLLIGKTQKKVTADLS